MIDRRWLIELERAREQSIQALLAVYNI